MKPILIRVAQCVSIAAVPVVIYAFSSGPPIMRTGAAVDGGQNCTACHNTFGPANSGAGKVTIGALTYSPGVKQNVTVTVQDPDALRWGFQLIARLASDETKQAGSFSTSDDVRVRCAPAGADGPCNGALEFAEHTAPGTRPGTTGSRTFTIEWTPPATNAGAVVFYAAGNAANNNGSLTGDRIYTTSLRISAPCTLTSRPTIRANGVVNGATFQSGISSNALITVFGGPFAGAGVSARAAQADLVGGKLPTEFACVALEIAGKRSPVFFVGESQINAQAPILDQSGPVEVRVIANPGGANELRSESAQVQAQAFSPAFFTFNGRSIAALNGSSNNSVVANSAVVASGSPAKPGDIVSLYGTGFGFSEPVFQPGEFASGAPRLRETPTVTIGGTTLAASDVLFAGLAPDAPGLYQFNVRIPAAASDGDLPVSMRIGGVETQSGATIPVRR